MTLRLSLAEAQDDLELCVTEQSILAALLQEPTRFRLEARVLDPRAFRWCPEHAAVARTIRRLAGAGRLAHWRRVRRAVATRSAARLVEDLYAVGGAIPNVAGLLAELVRFRRSEDLAAGGSRATG